MKKYPSIILMAALLIPLSLRPESSLDENLRSVMILFDKKEQAAKAEIDELKAVNEELLKRTAQLSRDLEVALRIIDELKAGKTQERKTASPDFVRKLETATLILEDGLDADYADYYSRVRANGGSLSEDELAAVETLIGELKTNGLWDDISRLFLHIGEDYLSAKTYVKGDGDLGSIGAVNLFDGEHYGRQHGFYKFNSNVWESTLDPLFMFDWHQPSAKPISIAIWGRNVSDNNFLGIHRGTHGQEDSFGFCNNAYSYGMLIKGRNSDQYIQESGMQGSRIVNEWQAGIVSYDGRRKYEGRNLHQSGAVRTTRLSLNSDHHDVTDGIYLSVNHPTLGFAICDGVAWSPTQMDLFNNLIRQFSLDCGVELTAVSPIANVE